MNEFDNGALLVQNISLDKIKRPNNLKRNILPSLHSHSKLDNNSSSRGEVFTPPLSKNGNKKTKSKGLLSSVNRSNKDKLSIKNSAPKKTNFEETEEYSDFESESITSSNPS